MEKYINKVLNHYLMAALWSSTDYDGNPLDDQYSIDDIDAESENRAINDIKRFLDLAGEAVDDIDIDQLGHDFWLTRCGHGTGFWDRGYSEAVESKLMHAVGHFSSLDVFVGDDNLIYI